MAVAAVVNVSNVKFPPVLEDFEGWHEQKKILVILAHPDDPEFFCGASISRWAAIGHEIHYCLLTKGQKGSQDPTMTSDQIAKIRVEEQNNAAAMLGIKSVEFLDYVDGEVFPDLNMRRKIVRVIRKHAPQIVLSSDPQNLIPSENRINHPDHRAAGQAVIDGVFPAAGNPMFFPELIKEEGLFPVNIQELWLSATDQPNLIVDMKDYYDNKLDAVFCHRSQITLDPEQFKQMMRSRFTIDPETGKESYPEKFKRLIF